MDKGIEPPALRVISYPKREARAPTGIDTLTTITCQYRWLAHSRSQQNQSLTIVAANPKRLRERLYWVNVSMPLKALARIDQIFWPPDLRQTDLVREEEEEREDLTPEEPGQEDTAQDGEADLAREEYFRDILRGYSSEARRILHQLHITGDPRSVLDEEWVQFFRDGLVETTYSGRGGVRSELKELIGKLLGEFQDGP